MSMRCLRRNKQPYWYAVYQSSATAYDEYGNETGGMDVTHAKPELVRANISPARNVDVIALFGTDLNYDKVLCFEERPPYDENAYLWIDTPPVLNGDGSTNTPPDYIVKRIAHSLNSTLVAVSREHIRYE